MNIRFSEEDEAFRQEITRLGAPDPEHAKACADAGVDRLIVHAMKPDLDGVRSIAEAFLGEVSR